MIAFLYQQYQKAYYTLAWVIFNIYLCVHSWNKYSHKCKREAWQSNTDVTEVVIWSLSIPGGSWGPAPGSGHHFSALGVCVGLLCDWQHPLHGYNGRVCTALALPPAGAGKGAELDYNLLFFDLCCVAVYLILWDWILLQTYSYCLDS